VRAACAGPGGLPLGSATHFHNVAIATHPVHRLQIRPIVHIPYHIDCCFFAPCTNILTYLLTPPSYIRVRAIVWACGREQTHRRSWPQYISRGLRLTRNVTTLEVEYRRTEWKSWFNGGRKWSECTEQRARWHGNNSDPTNYLIVIVSVSRRPAALMSSGLHAAPAVRVLDVTHWILHELVVDFYLRPLTSTQQWSISIYYTRLRVRT